MATFPYRYNRACRCARCRARGLMWPALLITLGLVFLSGREHLLFLPAILIVIGVVQLLRANAPTDGHIDPYLPVTPAPVPSPGNFNPPPPDTGTDYGKEEQHG